MAANQMGALEFLSKTFIHEGLGEYKILFKEESASDMHSGIQLMDHSIIDSLNTGIYLLQNEMHINHHHRFYSVC